jgi:hypothetical protein
MTAARAQTFTRNRSLAAILAGGLAAGVGDITYAFVASGIRGVGPVRVLQSVASGLLGRQAFEGGIATAALGAFLHFFIATTAAAVYFAASRKIDALVRRPVAFGLLFGGLVYFFMNFVVLPLSAIPFTRNYAPLLLAAELIGHMVLVGLPIALAARWGTDRPEAD